MSKSGDFHIRLPDELYRQLHELAQKEVRTINGQVEWFIRRGLEQYDARTPETISERSSDPTRGRRDE